MSQVQQAGCTSLSQLAVLVLPRAQASLGLFGLGFSRRLVAVLSLKRGGYCSPSFDVIHGFYVTPERFETLLGLARIEACENDSATATRSIGTLMEMSKSCWSESRD